MADRIACPNCGSSDTVEALNKKLSNIKKHIDKLEREQFRQKTLGNTLYVPNSASWSIHSYSDAGSVNNLEVCVGCGLAYAPNIHELVDNINGQINNELKKAPLDFIIDNTEV